MVPQLAAAVVEGSDGEGVGVDEFRHRRNVAEMAHRFVAELERHGGRRQVPVLEAATAEAVDTLLHSNHTDVGHGRILEPGDLSCYGVHRDEGALLSTHKEKRLVSVALRKIHNDSVLIDDVINRVLENIEFAIHTRQQNVAIQRNKHLCERLRYDRYTS